MIGSTMKIRLLDYIVSKFVSLCHGESGAARILSVNLNSEESQNGFQVALGVNFR
jgi:hypothetical protein